MGRPNEMVALIHRPVAGCNGIDRARAITERIFGKKEKSIDCLNYDLYLNHILILLEYLINLPPLFN